MSLPAGYDYRRIWLWLCLGWLVSSMDRTITGPIVTWMIQNKVSFMATENPYAIGGLVGSIFFTGYMLTQFPGGYAGDRHGHRSVIIISLFWASIATLLTGLASGLVFFIAARIFTGVGEGVYYANDRAIIAETTPVAQRSMAMGIVITGLSIGITVATLGGAYLVEAGRPILGTENAWRLPLFVLAVLSLIIGIGVRRELWVTRQPEDRPTAALRLLGSYAAVFFVLVFAVFLIARFAGLPSWGLTLIELILAIGFVLYVYRVKGQELSGAVQDRNLVLLYVSFIPILWNLWFFGFWAISIVSTGRSSFIQAALTAMFTGLSGIIGFPLGGWIADRTLRMGLGRRPILLGFTLLQGIITIIFAYYLQQGGSSLTVMALLLFFAGLFFNALQPVSHAMVAELAAPEQRGSAFGTYNLIGEIGAVLAPTVSGTLRDGYGSWVPAVYLDGFLILGSFLCVLFVREASRTSVLGEPAGVTQ